MRLNSRPSFIILTSAIVQHGHCILAASTASNISKPTNEVAVVDNNNNGGAYASEIDYLEVTSHYSFMDDLHVNHNDLLVDGDEGISFTPAANDASPHSNLPDENDDLFDASLLEAEEVASRVAADSNNMLTNQVICGYQGWFGTPGDGSPLNRWKHWFRSNTTTTYEQLTVDMYPTTDEYNSTDLVESNMKMPNGSHAKFFSSARPNVVLKHFEWMQTYGITGVFHHRFVKDLENVNVNTTRTMVLKNVRHAARATGRKFAVSYDLAGSTNSAIERLKSDWMYLVDVQNITSSTGYIRQNGLPALHIFGIGLASVNITDTSGMQDLINWLRSPTSGKYQVWLLGGIPSQWRTQGSDSKQGTAWRDMYHSLDGIAPWHVGRYKTTDEFDSYYTSIIEPDATYCQQRGILYMPTMWPGFSWKNLKSTHPDKPSSVLNYIPREGGKFMWRMAYKYVSNPNINSIWVAQFDEVDESTAIFKVTARSSDNPQPTNGWLALDADGYTLPSDWYLRLTGEVQLMLEGKRTLTSTIPLNPLVPHTPRPTTKPSASPTGLPTANPTTPRPTSKKPTSKTPTTKPTTTKPTSRTPTTKPVAPTRNPTRLPTSKPSKANKLPTTKPTSMPTSSRPTTNTPTSVQPTSVRPISTSPTALPTTSNPTQLPTSTASANNVAPLTSKISTPSCKAISVGDSTNRKCMGRNGIMFDVAVRSTSSATIVITAIEVNIMNGTSAQVWTKNGSYVGFETRMGNWTKITGKTTKECFNDHSFVKSNPLLLTLLYVRIQFKWSRLDNYSFDTRRNN